MMTGLAAALANRSSMFSSRSCGITECAWCSDSDQPGRIGSGTSIRANTAAASTALVVGAMMPARMLLVATSMAMVSSALRITPSAYRHMMSSVFVSMGTSSPGRSAVTGVNGRLGRFTDALREDSLAKFRRPRSMSSSSRYCVRLLGSGTAPGPCSSSSRRWISVNITERATVE